MSTLLAILYLIGLLGGGLFLIFYAANKRTSQELQRNSQRLGVDIDEYHALLSVPNRKQKARRISSYKRLKVFERDEWRCRFCGGQNNLVIDHIFPVSKGGGNQIENLQTLCKNCNDLKGNKVL
jgi:5-methylcytosine-specific restriction endonuclease McrA